MDLRFPHQVAPREHRFVKFDGKRGSGRTFACAGWMLDRIVELELGVAPVMLAWVGARSLFRLHVVHEIRRQAEARGIGTGAININGQLMVEGRTITPVEPSRVPDQIRGYRLAAAVVDVPDDLVDQEVSAMMRAERVLVAEAERSGGLLAFAGAAGAFALPVRVPMSTQQRRSE